MKRHPSLPLFFAWISTAAFTMADAPIPPQDPPKIQLAILLDTSSSMDGLIEQAKTQLWKIVNTFIAAKQDGKTPFVEVALYEYGNDGLDATGHWIRKIQPLSRDLDQISSSLFALRTNGGSEYCGEVIQRAQEDLAWDPNPKTYKAIFIAGNEPFTQGPVQPENACKIAIAKGITVNTIFCGLEKDGLNTGWKSGASAADGNFMTINSDHAVVEIPAPQDAEIVKLNQELNKTYIAYGHQAAAKAESQVREDTNAASKAASGAMVQRSVAKASVNYSNASWDLVDAAKDQNFKIETIANDELPKEMQALDAEGKKRYVAEKNQQRSEIQQKILTLNQQRDAFVAEERKKSANSPANSLDEVMTKTVRAQATKKGLIFE